MAYSMIGHAMQGIGLKIFIQTVWFIFFLLIVANWVLGQAKTETEKNERLRKTFSNPIISGFAPDPSICRAGDDFYLINSTFEYFPAIPIYHSRDLINWELIGNALDRDSQVDLEEIASSDGIHASTIRYHQGTFYIITTNNKNGVMTNFIVTAKDPRGPWSEPFVLEEAPGIDPSLFFDDDGRVWYTGNRIPPDPEFEGQAEIWLQELDLKKMKLKGEKHYLWRGCCGGAWAEGPHIYKRNGYYYLLISEGGTLYEHAVVVAVSKKITGPYQSNPRNPILTHRNLSYNYPITGVGHADLVQLKDGRWYMVALGWRYIDGLHGILGRETFLLPIVWETEPYWWKKEKISYPVAAPQTGKIELRYPVPVAGTTQKKRLRFRDDFDQEKLDPEWNFRRSPQKEFYSLRDKKGTMRLYLQPGRISLKSHYSFAGIRQRHFQFAATTLMNFSPVHESEEAGLTVIQNDRSAFVMSLTKSDDSTNQIRLKHLSDEQDKLLAAAPFRGEKIFLKSTGDYLSLNFLYSADGENWTELKKNVDAARLSPAILRGYNYTGVYLGLYASSNGRRTQNFADFDWFEYRFTGSEEDGWFFRQIRKLRNQTAPLEQKNLSLTRDNRPF